MNCTILSGREYRTPRKADIISNVHSFFPHERYETETVEPTRRERAVSSPVDVVLSVGSVAKTKLALSKKKFKVNCARTFDAFFKSAFN